METVPGIPKSSPPPGSWVPGSVGGRGDINSILLNPCGAGSGWAAGTLCDPVRAKTPRLELASCTMNRIAVSDDIISSTVKL